MESELLALLHNAKPNRDKLDELIKSSRSCRVALEH